MFLQTGLGCWKPDHNCKACKLGQELAVRHIYTDPSKIWLGNGKNADPKHSEINTNANVATALGSNSGIRGTTEEQGTEKKY